MPTRILARRVAALIACKVLHRSGELDDSLQPIGKEGFRAAEPDWENFELEKTDEDIVFDNLEPRPGTTKRRQYYYKRVNEHITIIEESIPFIYLSTIDSISVFRLPTKSRYTSVFIPNQNDP